VIGSSPGLGDLWREILEAGREQGLQPVGEEAYQALRVLAGLPEGGAEIDERANPMELGLDDSYSLDKGCYTGQEVLAKMVTHRSVKRALVGLELPVDCPAPPGTTLRHEGEAVGRITSAVSIPGTRQAVALALVGREHLEACSSLHLEEGGQVRVVPLPFPAEGH
jgi:folate-binding protein YgfZ